MLLTVPPGMVAGGNVIRLWMHYDGPPVPRGNGPGNPPLTTPQSSISYTSVISNVLQPVDQQYVALSCDTDGAYAATYRYGFNGQQKDDEIAGKGNHNTALFWEYDTRLGRRWNLDPKQNTTLSRYSCFSGNPPLNTDIFGDNSILYSLTGKLIGKLNDGLQNQIHFFEVVDEKITELTNYVENVNQFTNKEAQNFAASWARTISTAYIDGSSIES